MIKTIPLNKLTQSPRNVRRHSDAAADAELKASIAARGLLQNLIVRPAAKGKFEVEAGERRRRAMLELVADKTLPRDHAVACLVIEDADEAAVETSLAENFHRLAMNPADEAQAFASLVEGGASSDDVAQRFGLTVRFVEGRLRLARLAPIVFEALASGEITLDMAKAFGATSDQETRVLKKQDNPMTADPPIEDGVWVPTGRLLRLPEVMARVGLKRSAIYQRMTEGRFPKSRSLGPKCTVWIESEIDEWIRRVARG